MTIAADALGANPLASQTAADPATATKPPKKRQIVAKADAVDRPEAR